MQQLSFDLSRHRIVVDVLDTPKGWRVDVVLDDLGDADSTELRWHYTKLGRGEAFQVAEDAYLVALAYLEGSGPIPA